MGFHLFIRMTCPCGCHCKKKILLKYSSEKREKVLTNGVSCTIMFKLSRNAAIAQPVERILGKDEVASSNLASSSKNKRPLNRVVFCF